LLAEEFGVTTRTIRRDFEVLESVGYVVPKWADRNRRTA
jgi:DeoR/GlpR family transcriptional regulator of sugar metabolism